MGGVAPDGLVRLLGKRGHESKPGEIEHVQLFDELRKAALVLGRNPRDAGAELGRSCVGDFDGALNRDRLGQMKFKLQPLPDCQLTGAARS